VALIETELNKGLAPAKKLDNVVDARVLRAIAVIELKRLLIALPFNNNL